MASKRHVRQSVCGDKRQHLTEQDADRHAARLHVLRALQGVKYRSYRCCWCGYFHCGRVAGTEHLHRP